MRPYFSSIPQIDPSTMTSKTADTVALFLGELLGTALLLFLGCMGCLSWGKEPNNLQVTLSFGMIVMIIIQIFGCVSGAHLNPVVSIAAVVYGIINTQVRPHNGYTETKKHSFLLLLYEFRLFFSSGSWLFCRPHCFILWHKRWAPSWVSVC